MRDTMTGIQLVIQRNTAAQWVQTKQHTWETSLRPSPKGFTVHVFPFALDVPNKASNKKLKRCMPDDFLLQSCVLTRIPLLL